MGEVRALKPGMERSSGQAVDQFIATSLADYIASNGKRPDGVIVMWIGPEGEMTVGWDNATRHDLAFASTYVGSLAVASEFE